VGRAGKPVKETKSKEANKAKYINRSLLLKLVASVIYVQDELQY
jgi:hypothetical protein